MEDRSQIIKNSIRLSLSGLVANDRVTADFYINAMKKLEYEYDTITLACLYFRIEAENLKIGETALIHLEGITHSAFYIEISREMQGFKVNSWDLPDWITIKHIRKEVK